MIREDSKYVVKDLGLKDIEYYDATIDYKTKLIALIKFISDKKAWYYICDDFIVAYHKKEGIVISTSDVVDSLSIPDIRNKLSPITHMISLLKIDNCPQGYIKDSIKSAEKAVKDLAQF
jgi:hypothetical protein